MTCVVDHRCIDYRHVLTNSRCHAADVTAQHACIVAYWVLTLQMVNVVQCKLQVG